jgi:hypothetical protein
MIATPATPRQSRALNSIRILYCGLTNALYLTTSDPGRKHPRRSRQVFPIYSKGELT